MAVSNVFIIRDPIEGDTHLFLFGDIIPADPDTYTFLKLPVVRLLRQQIQLGAEPAGQINIGNVINVFFMTFPAPIFAACKRRNFHAKIVRSTLRFGRC